jgi:sigma-70-like protein
MPARKRSIDDMGKALPGMSLVCGVSSMMREFPAFESPAGVIRALVTYTDWWQPASGSVIQTGGARRASKHFGDGIRSGLLETLDQRSELCRRMGSLSPQERHVLFLWYVRQSSVDEIASELGISRRQCFRRRSAAVDAIVDAGARSAEVSVA